MDLFSTYLHIFVGNIQRIQQTSTHSDIRTYLYKADASSRKRFFLLFTAVCGSFMWWLGPVFGIFIVDPLITLTLLDQQVVTVESNCFDSRLANQTCDSDVFVEYYFYNITNQDEVWTRMSFR